MQKQPIAVIYINANLNPSNPSAPPRFYLLFYFLLTAGKTYKIDYTTNGSTYSTPPQTVVGSGQLHTVTVEAEGGGSFPRVIEQA